MNKVESIKLSEDKANALEEAKTFGEGFLDCVCDECKDKCTRWMKKHIYLMPFPNVFGKKLQGLMCKDCRTKIVMRLKRK